jgi:NADPH:quinone reductase-like Zn-dependent oxidoreductase
MKAILFERFGEPRMVLKVCEAPRPEPGHGEVRVCMRASPINPSDLLVVRGQYGRLPSLPATPGFEGVGVIDAVGPGLLARLRRLKPGRRVAVLNGSGGNWQQYVVLSARFVVPMPDDLPDEQVAAFFVNPASALVMTRDVLRVPAGAWLVQTAAGSALGRMVIRLSRYYGFHTINLVRRRALEGELKALGADAVLVAGEDNVPVSVRELTGGRGAAFGLDAVGGAATLDVLRCLAPRGRLLVYGTLASDPVVPLEPRLLMVGQKAIEGFWLSEWVRAQGVLAMLGLFRRIKALMRSGVLTTPVAGVFPLERLDEALQLAEQPGRAGKVLLRLDGQG